MGVYTQFGSIAGLVQSVVADGFHRLGAGIGAVPHTDDPVADLVAITRASIDFARTAPNLYQVMFGTIALGQYRPTTPAELHTGRPETLDLVVGTCERAIAAHRFRHGDPSLIAHQWWCAVHGYNMLEIGGYIRPPASEKKVLVPMLETIFSGLGDDPDRIRASLRPALDVDSWQRAMR